MSRELHIGVVTRNTDPASEEGLKGAVFFQSESLTGGVEYGVPAQPCFPFAGNNKGFFYVPSPGDVIQIEIGSNPELANPRYQCGIYSNEDDIDDLFKTNYPNRMGWVSTSGHFFIFDETKGEELVELGHTLGTKLSFDFSGDWLEKIVRSKVEDILKDKIVDIGGSEVVSVMKNRNIQVNGVEDKHVTKGDYVHEVTGDYILKVNGTFRPEITSTSGRQEQVDEESVGFRKVITGGGLQNDVAGSKTENVMSNSEQTVGGTDRKFVGFDADHVYGTGKNESILLGNMKNTLTAGDFITNVLAGNIDLNTLAGLVKLANALGGVTVGLDGSVTISNAIGGSVKVDLTGNVFIDGTTNVFLGGAGLGDIATGGVLTFANNPVVDSIVGAPSIPSIRVIAK